MARRVIIGYPELEQMLFDASTPKTIRAIITVAIEKWQKEEISGYAIAGLLRKASDKIYSMSDF